MVVGDVGLDRFEYGEVERISPEAPVPVVRVRSSKKSPGLAANVSANIAALGARAILIGAIGSDAEGAQLSGAISAGHDSSQVLFLPVVDSSRKTTIKTRYIAGSQQVARADQEDTHPIENTIEDDVIRKVQTHLESCDVVVISDYAKGVLTDRVLSTVIDMANKANRPVLVDPKRSRLSAYRGATVIKPNAKELFAATGLPCRTDEEAQSAAAEAIEATGSTILLTRSENGMSLFRPGMKPVHARTKARQIFDVSGAGDTVLAIFSVAVGAGMPVEESLYLANIGAGIVVGKLGTATVGLMELIRGLDEQSRGFEGRIVDLEMALESREEWRRQGLLCGFTNGCFDLIHPGHISLLSEARRSCDRLIVAINTDQSVKRLKGPQRPLQNELARAYVLAAMEDVDLVVMFDDDTPRALIESLKPDVLVKGADYKETEVVGADLVKSWGGRLVLAKLVPEQSTSSLVRRSTNPMTAQN
jgi:D-beta-D-heptose 7-phosphate kinase/D-beta-D-heptose 1-phosphate adenosyltransferase